jgi:hypothetical protein
MNENNITHYPASGKKANLCLTMALKHDAAGAGEKADEYLAKAAVAEAEHQAVEAAVAA